ncbi:MAG: hypothetical protein MUO31_07980 [Thermodesulfovibrionales bacterium]|nr:hypothetical protein [Thermodesulfovibrionales bacterium]
MENALKDRSGPFPAVQRQGDRDKKNRNIKTDKRGKLEKWAKTGDLQQNDGIEAERGKQENQAG